MGASKSLVKITILGLWHLGSVTAACCAEHFETIGLDFEEPVIDALRQGRAPVMEPGLDALIAAGVRSGRLHFTSDIKAACEKTDVLWVCYDTPVNDEDEADTDFVLERIGRCLANLRPGAMIILSSQMPVGTCRSLEENHPGRAIACVPENLRLGKALDIARNPERIIIGIRGEEMRERLQALFSKWCDNLVWMSPESAEMTKHGINSFLALSITFMNELARICEQTGADAKEVERGIKSESRIGPGAYLRAGGAFAGGTLARDVVTLTRVALEAGEPLVLIPSIKTSNDQHKLWTLRKLQRELGSLRGRTIALLGLTYKPGTDTLRRSLAIELYTALTGEGAVVQAFDPAIKARPEEISQSAWRPDIASALADADAAVICTEWPEFKKVDWAELIHLMRNSLLIDANGFISAPPGARHMRVGCSRDS